MPHLQGKGGAQQLCGKCQEDCPVWESVFCDVCGNWHHIKCEQLEIQILQAFKELQEVPYICKSCRSDEKGNFSYEKSIHRLHKASKQGIEKLYLFTERERLFMKEELSYGSARNPKYSSNVQAQLLLQEYCPGEKKNAAKVTLNNNTLFGAVSLALTSSEKLTQELRVRCCIEMVVHDSFYRWQERCDQLSKCAPDYTESCLNCATPNEDSCVWTMAALASVIRRHIESIYPAVNGKMDRAVSILNTVFVPRNKIDSGENVKILWASSKRVSLTPGAWVPDSFAPLVDMPVFPLSPMVTSSPFNTPSRVSGRMRKPTAKIMAITSPKERNKMKVVVESTAATSDDDMGNDSDFEMPEEYTLEPADDSSFLGKYQHDMIDINWMDKFATVAKGGTPLTGTAFLSAQEVFNVLTTEAEVTPSIPAGRKEDVYYVVDNTRNMRYKHRRNYFQDDCGRYNQKSGTTCKSYYLLSDSKTLQPMIRNGDKYCRESKRVSVTGSATSRGRGRPPGRGRGRGRGGGGGGDQKVTKWIPMNPQPEEEKIVILHRYYSALEIDPTYKRRISWFNNLPAWVERGHDVFLAEYLTKPVPGIQLPVTRKRRFPAVSQVATNQAQAVDPVNDEEPASKKAKTEEDGVSGAVAAAVAEAVAAATETTNTNTNTNSEEETLKCSEEAEETESLEPVKDEESEPNETEETQPPPTESETKEIESTETDATGITESESERLEKEVETEVKSVNESGSQTVCD